MRVVTITASVLTSVAQLIAAASNNSIKVDQGIGDIEVCSALEDSQKEEKGVLEDGVWETVYQKEQVSHYKVKYKGKNISVIADWHTKPGRELFATYLEEIKKSPGDWILLVEGLDYREEVTSEIKEKLAVAKDLPGAGGAFGLLMSTKKVSPEDMAIAYGIGMLERIGTGIGVREEDAKNPLEIVCIRVQEGLEEDGVKISKEEVRELILRASETDEKLQEAVDNANKIFLGMAVVESDKMMRDVIREALKNDASNVLIHIGEGHLRALVNSGELRKYTESLMDRVKFNLKNVRKALEMSKKN